MMTDTSYTWLIRLIQCMKNENNGITCCYRKQVVNEFSHKFQEFEIEKYNYFALILMQKSDFTYMRVVVFANIF